MKPFTPVWCWTIVQANKQVLLSWRIGLICSFFALFVYKALAHSVKDMQKL